MGGILVIECKVLECGRVVVGYCCPKCFGSGLVCLGLVPDFNNFEKFQVFKF